MEPDLTYGGAHRAWNAAGLDISRRSEGSHPRPPPTESPKRERDIMKPSHIVKIKHRDSKHSTRVGAAWPTKNGNGINIKLDPGIAIFGGPDIFITLWPNEERSNGGGGRGGYGGQRGDSQDSGGYGGDFGEDDIPFAPVDERAH